MSAQKLKLITAATVTPVTLTEARAHLRIDDTAEDTLITTLIKVATEYAEKRLARAIITQTWEQYHDAFPLTNNFIEIKLPPLQSITSIKYFDTNNDEIIWANTEYELDTIKEPGIVRLQTGKSFPGTYDRVNAVTIRFVAGYGTAITTVPELIRAAIKLTISHFFENREGIQTFGTVQQIPLSNAVEILYNQFTVREKC